MSYIRNPLFVLPILVVLLGCGAGDTPAVVGTVKTYTVGGTVTGIGSGKTVVLQNNSSDDLTITQDGSFTFAEALENGSTYNVTVKSQPQNQSCTVENGSGTISGSNITNVKVNCVDYDAKLTWDIPTTKADGTTLSNNEIGSYTVYYGTSSENYTNTKTVATTECQTTTCTTTIDSLNSGTYYFVVTVSDTSGNESDYSNEVSKAIQ